MADDSKLDGKGKLYANPERDRFFWIPEGQAVPGGTLVLRTLMGNRIDIDPAAAPLFEVSEADAQAIAQRRLESVTQKAGRFMAGAAGILAQASPAAPRPKKPSSDAGAASGLAESLAATAERFKENPTEGLEAFRSLAGGLSDMLRKSLLDDPKGREEAQASFDALAGLLKDELGVGEGLADRLKNAPESLRETLGKPELEEKVREMTARLKSFGSGAAGSANEAPAAAPGDEPPGEPEASD